MWGLGSFPILSLRPSDLFNPSYEDWFAASRFNHTEIAIKLNI